MNQRKHLFTGNFQQGWLARPEANFMPATGRIYADDAAFYVEARIPFASIDFDPGISHPHLKMALCRYDTTPGEAEPVLSATPPFPEANYHNRAAWHPIEWTV